MRHILHCPPCIYSNSASTKGMLTATIQSSLYFTQHADHPRKFQGREGKCRSKVKYISGKEKERSYNRYTDIRIFEVQFCCFFPRKISNSVPFLETRKPFTMLSEFHWTQ